METSYKIGQVVSGKVTGVQAYGVFLALDDDTQGLIHISECRHGYMDNVYDFAKVGQDLQAKIIDIDEYTGKISLSVRALQSLDIPLVPQRRKKSKKRYTPTIGFASLANALPGWIEEAQEKFVKDKHEQSEVKEEV